MLLMHKFAKNCAQFFASEPYIFYRVLFLSIYVEFYIVFCFSLCYDKNIILRERGVFMDYALLDTYTSSSIDPSTTLVAAIASIFSTVAIFSLIWYILIVIAQWKIFTKAGEAGWKCLIPIYNFIILFKISGLSPWLVLVYLLGFIPVVGSIICLVISIILWYKLSCSFGHGAGYTVGLIFLNPIFLMILGFGSSEYVGSAPQKA